MELSLFPLQVLILLSSSVQICIQTFDLMLESGRLLSSPLPTLVLLQGIQFCFELGDLPLALESLLIQVDFVLGALGIELFVDDRVFAFGRIRLIIADTIHGVHLHLMGLQSVGSIVDWPWNDPRDWTSVGFLELPVVRWQVGRRAAITAIRVFLAGSWRV